MDLLVQFVEGGRVVASLRECSQVLEMLQVLGMDTKQVVLEKNEGREIVKEEPEIDAPGSEDDEEVEEINIVYEGQSSNVARADRISFVPVKTEAAEATTENETEISRARLTPLLSPTPPAASSTSSLQRFGFQDVVSAGMLARGKDKRGLEMLREGTGGTSKKMKNT